MQKRYRLNNSRSFDYIYKRGKSVSDENLVLITMRGKYPSFKVGFVVGKKVGKSVVRNKVRRRMREAFRVLLGEVEDHSSYIFVARSGAAEADYQSICNSVKGLLKKAGKLKQ
jgi:ribonuclease P protein component